MAVRRIQQDWQGLVQSPPWGIAVADEIDGNLFSWTADVQGPKGGPYGGGVFKVRLNFPERYPDVAPKITFVTKVWHPNVKNDGSGNFCLDVLTGSAWEKSIPLKKVLVMIQGFLQKPNIVHPGTYNPEAGNQLRDDPAGFARKAREWTQSYARPPPGWVMST
jgi:ubiquitin-conjugating enzyme E2 D/E